jgi:hypothetical protein
MPATNALIVGRRSVAFSIQLTPSYAQLLYPLSRSAPSLTRATDASPRPVDFHLGKVGGRCGLRDHTAVKRVRVELIA